MTQPGGKILLPHCAQTNNRLLAFRVLQWKLILLFSSHPSFLHLEAMCNKRHLELSRDLNSNLSPPTRQLAGLGCIASSPFPLLQLENKTPW